MAIMKPFKAFRPKLELAKLVASLPYDVMDAEEARKLVRGNPYSFLHVDKAEINLDPHVNPYHKSVYKTAKITLNRMISDEVLIQDKEKYLYIYKQTMNGRSQVGLVGCASIDDYLNNVIKKHEHTRDEKEQDRINHVDFCNANTGPIFLTYRESAVIQQLTEKWMHEHKPVNDFVADDQVTHTVWIVDDKDTVNALESAFRDVESLYIADGHHRAASAVKVGIMRRKQFKNHTGNEEFNFFLCVSFPDSQLHIMDYNRVVKDLNQLSKDELIAKIGDAFFITEYSGSGPYRPEEKHSFGMFLEGKWYVLQAKEGTFAENDPLDRLDVSILQNNLLSPILGVKDPKTDKRIDFVGGIRGLEELERRVKSDMKVAFSMYPTTIDDLMAIADAGEVMPPKSTWFEPKLRSGLFIHEL